MGKARLTKAGEKSLVARLGKFRDDALRNVGKLHVKIQPGNKKTGPNCWTVSLLPVIDCLRCVLCTLICYDLKSDCVPDSVAKDRARNSAIHSADPARYWREIDEQVKEYFVMLMRINVGGDLTDEDFKYVAELGRSNPRTMFLFFTKNYDGINSFLDADSFPENVHPILSAWFGMELKNPHNLPVSHVKLRDGKTTAPMFGAKYCRGNCSACAFWGEGCWTLQNGEHLIFDEH